MRSGPKAAPRSPHPSAILALVMLASVLVRGDRVGSGLLTDSAFRQQCSSHHKRYGGGLAGALLWLSVYPSFSAAVRAALSRTDQEMRTEVRGKGSLRQGSTGVYFRAATGEERARLWPARAGALASAAVALSPLLAILAIFCLLGCCLWFTDKRRAQDAARGADP